MVHLLFLFSRHSTGSARSACGGNGWHCILAAIPMSAGMNEWFSLVATQWFSARKFPHGCLIALHLFNKALFTH